MFVESLEPTDKLKDCGVRLLSIDAHTGQLRAEVELPEKSVSFHQVVENGDQTYLWCKIGNQQAHYELRHLPDLELVTSTDPRAWAAEYEPLRNTLKGHSVQIDGRRIVLTDNQGHIWNIDAFTGEIESLLKIPQRRLNQKDGLWSIELFLDYQVDHPFYADAWAGLRKLEVRECPRCRLHLIPEEGEETTTEAVFFEPRILGLRYDHGRHGRSRSMKTIPLTLLHRENLAKDADRLLSHVRLDGSVAWTRPSVWTDYLWIDQEVIVLHQDPRQGNDTLIALDLETGQPAWTLAYPHPPEASARPGTVPADP